MKPLSMVLGFVFFIICGLVGCKAMLEHETIQISNTAYLTGKVLISNGNYATLSTETLFVDNPDSSEFQRLATLIAQNTLLVRGIETRVEGKKAFIDDIRGTTVTFRFEESVKQLCSFYSSLKNTL